MAKKWPQEINELFEVEPERDASTKWFGMVAVIGLPIGWSLTSIATSSLFRILLLLPLVPLTVAYIMAARSMYFHSATSNRPLPGVKIDERQAALYYRATSYAYIIVAAGIVLTLLYCAIATQLERRWWLPHSASEFFHVIMPICLVLPILPAVITEWLDPISALDVNEGEV